MLEYFIVRNAKIPRLFDVVAVHFEREEGTVVKSELEYQEAVDQVEYLTAQSVTV